MDDQLLADAPVQLEDPSSVRPRALFWFRIYAAVLSFACLAAGVWGLGMLRSQLEMASLTGYPPLPRAKGAIIGLIVTMALLLVMSAMTFILPRRRWVWAFDAAVICFGMIGGTTAAPAVLLLIEWLKPEVKAYFGIDPHSAGHA